MTTTTMLLMLLMMRRPPEPPPEGPGAMPRRRGCKEGTPGGPRAKGGGLRGAWPKTRTQVLEYNSRLKPLLHGRVIWAIHVCWCCILRGCLGCVPLCDGGIGSSQAGAGLGSVRVTHPVLLTLCIEHQVT
jgi:hypothetical protein